MRTSSLALALALALPACKSQPDLKRTYEGMLADYSEDDGTAGLSFKIDKRQREKCEQVLGWYEDGKFQTPEDFLYGAKILAMSDVRDQLELASDLAVRAAELGEESAYAVQAVAVDRILLIQKLPQRYGTQVAWEPLLGKWRLYDVDPLTTDEVRIAMGIPTLAELQARVKALNGSELTQAMRDLGHERGD